MTATRRLSALTLAMALGAAACSGNVSFNIGGQSPEEAAEELIEGGLADQIGLALAAACVDIDDPAEGDQFPCIATTNDGRIIDFEVDIGDGEVFANTVNLLLSADVPGFEQATIDALAEQIGQDIPEGSLDCGEGPIIVPPDRKILCRLSDWGSTKVYDTTLTITDQQTWAFDIDVAADPS